MWWESLGPGFHQFLVDAVGEDKLPVGAKLDLSSKTTAG
jgi:hypothetical protein